MKYRQLTLDELENLDKEFVSYLSVHGIDVALWNKYKITWPEKVEELISEFSDLVFEKICSKIEYLYFETKHIHVAYHVKTDHSTMVGIESKIKASMNDREDQEVVFDDAEIYKLDKKHQEDRNKEVFNLLNIGCLKSDGREYKEMILQWANIKNETN